MFVSTYARTPPLFEILRLQDDFPSQVKVRLLPQVEFCTGVATSPLLFIVCVGKITCCAEAVPSPGWHQSGRAAAV